MPVERPSFRELYETQTMKMDNIEKRLSRMEKGFILLTAVVAAPKVGGPDASRIIAEAVRNYLATITGVM
jgi:hypothetical protein